MAISFTRYVNITSGVGAGAAVATRDLIGRLFTTSEQVPTGTVVEFTDLADVATYFETTSEEYLRAQFYFSFLSKNITRPRRIAFARWANVDTSPQIFGATANTTLATYQAVTAGGFTITLGGAPSAVTGLDLSGVSSFADVATALQTAIRALSGDYTSVTVTYNAVRTRFEFDLVTTGTNTIAVTDGAQGPLAIIGWLGGARLSDGVVAETVTEVLTETTQVTNNFGSFLFIPDLTLDQYEQAGNWNAAQNVMFQFMVPVASADAETYSARLIGIAGLGMTLVQQADEYPEMLPMNVLAATDYSRRASVQNYMFQQQSGLTPLITTTQEANRLDPLRVNYYGRTQTAGQFIDFYQRGFLGGGATAPTSMNTYANEQWLKDTAGARIMELLLNKRVSANATGRANVLSILTSEGGVIEIALLNGTISVGKTLTPLQRIFVTEQTGDALAYIQVENAGYWIDAAIASEVVDGITNFSVSYTLIYGQDDVVRSVEGTHTLI